MQAGLHCSLDAPSQSQFHGLSFAVWFRRRHRCAPVHRETGEMLAILFWCAPAFGDLLLREGFGRPLSATLKEVAEKTDNCCRT